jgi:hypothetical protein
MKTGKPISPLQFSPIGGRVGLAMLFMPLAIAAIAWVWALASPDSLWQVANAARSFSFYVTSLVAMPAVYDPEFPVQSFFYALVLVGWVIFTPLHVILLFRFRRHIPTWLRSKAAREAEKMQRHKPWLLPAAYLIWFVMLLDILFFGQIIQFAELGISNSNGHPSFGASMFRLGGTLFLFYALTMAVVQRAIFRLYRDKNPIAQAGI